MIPLIGILLCFYLVFKGIEILQIALCAPPSGRQKAGIALGGISLAACVVIAAFFAFALLSSSVSIPQFPTR
jgi:hypothetical protein